MAYFQRLALIILFCLPSFLPNTALAATGAKYWFTDNNVLAQLVTPDGADAACLKYQDYLRSIYSTSPYNYTRLSNTATQCTIQTTYKSSGGVANTNTYPINFAYTCDGSTFTNINAVTPPSCTSCTAPLIETNGVCGPPPPCTVGPAGYFGVKQPVGWDKTLATTSRYACKDGCQTKLDPFGSMFYFAANSSGEQFVVGDNLYTGNTCTPSSTTPAPTTANPDYKSCAEKGMSYGTVNGVGMCVPVGSKGSLPTAKETPPKVTNNTAAPTPENLNPTPTTTTGGSTQTSVTPSETGGEPDVTQTTTNADGSKTEKKQPMSSFCEENPTSQICKQAEKSAFGSSCADGLVVAACEGDAIQCAIAKKQAEMDCKFFKTDTAMDAAYSSAMAEGSTNSPAGAINHETSTIQSSLNASSSFAASCPADVYFNFGGKAIKMPISTWCPYLEAVGYIFLALSYVVAARMLAGSV